MRVAVHTPWVLLGLQASLLLALSAGGLALGFGLRSWFVIPSLIGGAAAFVALQSERSLTLDQVRRLTRTSAVTTGVVLALANGFTSDLPLDGRVAITFGTLLLVTVGAGVLTLCGLSLGLGQRAPQRGTLRDPTQPAGYGDRPRK